MKNDSAIMPNGTVAIFLYHRDGSQEIVMIDHEDLHYATEFPGSWYPFKHQRSGLLYARGYYKDKITGKVLQPMLHRLISQALPGKNTVHIDGNTLNCIRENMANVKIGDKLGDPDTQYLPPAMQPEITPEPDPEQVPKQNTPTSVKKLPSESVPVKGVSLHKKKNRWEVKPYDHGKRIPLGYWPFDELAEANAAAEEFRRLGADKYFKKYPKNGKAG